MMFWWFTKCFCLISDSWAVKWLGPGMLYILLNRTVLHNGRIFVYIMTSESPYAYSWSWKKKSVNNPKFLFLAKDQFHIESKPQHSLENFSICCSLGIQLLCKSLEYLIFIETWQQLFTFAWNHLMAVGPLEFEF